MLNMVMTPWMHGISQSGNNFRYYSRGWETHFRTLPTWREILDINVIQLASPEATSEAWATSDILTDNYGEYTAKAINEGKAIAVSDRSYKNRRLGLAGCEEIS
eukprot:13918005-Ditylum_brightwellii.AAC.1